MGHGGSSASVLLFGSPDRFIAELQTPQSPSAGAPDEKV